MAEPQACATRERRRRRRRAGGRNRRRQDRLSRRLGQGSVLMVGNLKVGKSTMFGLLAGRKQYSVVHPDTETELACASVDAGEYSRLIDAPGVNSLFDRSEDAYLLRDLLARRYARAILMVLDAKNLRRGLSLLLQVATYGVPMVVALNMVDEASQRGLRIDVDALSKLLGVPVVATVAPEGRGLGQLRRALALARPLTLKPILPEAIETGLVDMERILEGQPLAARGLSLSLLADLPCAVSEVDQHLNGRDLGLLRERTQAVRESLPSAADLLLTEAALTQAEGLAEGLVKRQPPSQSGLVDKLTVWTRRPLTGLPIAVLVLSLVYLFVGTLGAGYLVDLLEGRVFGDWLLPWVEQLVAHIPWAWLRELLTGQFGLISVGVVLSVGIVAPVLATFFFAFALLEESGYLPRLSVLFDRAMRRIGLNGKGVLPMIMGLSCVTMAVLTTRVLETRKQRFIATLLLMLAMPCAPLLGVIMVVLARLEPVATPILWLAILLQFLVVGVLANRILPGRRPDFIMELPPIRIPGLRSIFSKTGHRLWWFLREAIPYFIIGTFVLYLFDQFGWLDGFRDAMRPVLERWLDLPTESSDVFLMTMIRREAGAALLAQQAASGLYDGVQILVTLLVMTLMVPCINSVLVTYKERGVGPATGIMIFVVVYSLGVGTLFNWLLRASGVAI
ncbi:MAG: ferrous iron transport protein B [Deltaproteobacteria bacterium]|nr:ferrous iron transport protein B [Deltaproteobacteria bacterium]